MSAETADHNRVIIDCDDFKTLFRVLAKSGYTIFGPTRNDQAIIYDRIRSVEDLPVGWLDHQDGGTYRLIENERPALFDFVVGPHSWKKYLHRPVRNLMKTTRRGKHLKIVEVKEVAGKQAFIGVRACELAAVAIQDKILREGPYSDAGYSLLREKTFIVAVNCLRPGGTCFCHSMETGPRVTHGFDLVLTEVIDNGRHHFLAESGSPEGKDILRQIPNRLASDEEIDVAERAIEKAADHMGRRLETADLKNLLERNFDNLHWEKIAKKCLTCGNCTLVCPTCFCTNVEDETDLNGDSAVRRRLWDTCFTIGFTYIHGGSIRSTEMSRYRQWMMHKLCYWRDQFGSYGCVGCGRCITWCPVGIDLTEETRIIAESEK